MTAQGQIVTPSADHTPAGWPRPRAAFQPWAVRDETPPPPRNLPVPWVTRVRPGGDVEFTDFHEGADQAHIDRLCQICGLELGTVILLGVSGVHGGRPHTSGPGCHPRCMALAMSFCPHFGRRRNEPDRLVAYRYEGAGAGYEVGSFDPDNDMLYGDENPIDSAAVPLTLAEVKELARRDPLGAATATPQAA